MQGLGSYFGYLTRTLYNNNVQIRFKKGNFSIFCCSFAALLRHKQANKALILAFFNSHYNVKKSRADYFSY